MHSSEKNTCKCCLKNENECNHSVINSRDYQEDFENLTKDYLDKHFNIMHEKFKDTLQRYKDMISNNNERVEMQIEYKKDEIEIKIESLKIELDKLQEIFKTELDEKWKTEFKSISLPNLNEQHFQNELLKLENDINEPVNLTKDNLIYYKQKIETMEKIINKDNENTPLLNFTESKLKIDKSLIGNIRIESKYDKEIINKIKENEYKNTEIKCKPYDFCILPNDCIIVADYNCSKLQLYDENMHLIRKIDNKMHRIICLACDGNESLYMSDYGLHMILKTDFEFNILAKVGHGEGIENNYFRCPSGICCYKQHVFVCDNYNKRIQMLDSNLKLKASYALNYYPWYIKNIDNVCMVRSYGSDASIYFHDLNGFDILKRFDGHNGLIGCSAFSFYEYFSTSETFYFYDRYGELVETIQAKGLNLTSSYNNWGSICIVKSKLIMISYNQAIGHII